MHIDAAKLFSFSPTGTTQKVLEGIAQGLGWPEAEKFDLTRPKAQAQGVCDSGVLTVIGSPVYAGRLPAEAVRRLRPLRGKGGPAVLVVVYGNRAYEDALLELSNLALELGFFPVGAGAFIGEHSFSTPATPVAVGRPDAADLRLAREFGQAVAAKLAASPGTAAMDPLVVPGNMPYRDGATTGGLAPETMADECERCGQCVTACPVGCVHLEESGVVTDKTACIRCCACVKGCPTGARVMTDASIQAIATRLAANCKDRKAPEYFV